MPRAVPFAAADFVSSCEGLNEPQEVFAMHGWLIARRGLMVVGVLALLLQGLATPSLALTFGEIMLCVITAGQPDLCAGKLIPLNPPSLPPTTCTDPTLAGPPQFLSMPKGSARYPFSGGCSRADQTGVQLKYRWEGSWTPSETNPNKPNVSESIEITGYEPFLPNRAPGGKIYIYWTGRCNYDPWLKPETSGGCRRFGEFVPPDLREEVPDLMGQSFPQTRNVIPAADRQRFVADYLRANPTVAGPVLGGTAFPTAPTINSPTPNGYLIKGKGVFKITPSKYLTGTHAQYQLRWLNPPASYKGKGLDFYNQEIPVNLIASPTGLPVPQTLLAQGTWEIRVRINQPKVGDWSDWVRFEYLLQDPIKQTVPQQGFSSGAGTTLIRPRGVDEKGGKEGNETVDTTPETEKKP